jgi:membrane protein YdbS with pleckstrin-like domain
MLTEEDMNFIRYWEDNRLKKKKVWKQLSVGMPLGAALAGAILINIFSGWNKAGTVLQFDPQLMIIVLAAVLMIVIFIVIFSARHRWDMNEQHYRELLAKKDKE